MSENPAQRYENWQNHCNKLIEKLKKEEIIKKVEILPNDEYYKCKPNLEIELKYGHGVINYKNCKTIFFSQEEGIISISMSNSEIEGSRINQLHYLNSIKNIR